MADGIATIQRSAVTPKKVYVHVPAEIFYDLDRMQKISQSIFRRFGCPACHSGIMPFWVLMDDELVVEAKTLELTPIAQRIAVRAFD